MKMFGTDIRSVNTTAVTKAKLFSHYYSLEAVTKFNPYHDRLGRFTTATGATSFTYKPGKGKIYDNAIAREKERTASGGGSSAATPKKDKLNPETLAGVKRGKPMSFEEADYGTTNPKYYEGGGYLINCQTCVIANEARRRGYDVTARPKDTQEAGMIARNQRLAWIDPKTGSNPEYMEGCREVRTAKQAKKYLENNLKVGERYTLGHSWKGRSRSGHIICAYKDDNGNVRLFDPQDGEQMSGSEVDAYLNRLKYKAKVYNTPVQLGIRVLRVDDKAFNTNYVDKILTGGS